MSIENQSSVDNLLRKLFGNRQFANDAAITNEILSAYRTDHPKHIPYEAQPTVAVEAFSKKHFDDELRNAMVKATFATTDVAGITRVGSVEGVLLPFSYMDRQPDPEPSKRSLLETYLAPRVLSLCIYDGKEVHQVPLSEAIIIELLKIDSR